MKIELQNGTGQKNTITERKKGNSYSKIKPKTETSPVDNNFYFAQFETFEINRQRNRILKSKLESSKIMSRISYSAFIDKVC